MDKNGQQIELSARDSLKTPRAAAIAGILFSILLGSIMVLLRCSGPESSVEPQDWSSIDVDTVKLALHLVPFAGIAFLWFMGVVRDRFGKHEDQLLSTVFFGSGVLFLASFFIAAGIGGAVLIGLVTAPKQMIDHNAFTFGRIASGQIMNVFALKMAGVFMTSTATLAIRTRILPLWITVPGFVFAALLLTSAHFVDWMPLLFPLWVLLLSLYILGDNVRIKNHNLKL